MRITSTLLLSFYLLFVQPVNAQVGIGTNTPDASSMLDLSSNTLGLLIPRVALTSATIAAPISSPATSLVIYNTATAGIPPNDLVPGFYYWNGSRWYPVVNKGKNAGDMQYWDGSKWVMVPASTTNGRVLTWCGGKPVWGPCGDSLILAPVNNPFEGNISDFYPTSFVTALDQWPITVWTSGGNPLVIRNLVKFDYSSIPTGATIDSARLYAYADLAPINGNLVDAHFGTANAFYIQRITSTWTTPSQFTWNSPPFVTASNQVTVPQSSSSFQDLAVDVTNLVRDQVSLGNNGFMMRLVTENFYNSRQYSSSKESNTNRIPRLKIYWRQ
ncbi:MAG: DNRLRE domain-containing protein [Bacteroidetes bacterium]|nr:DNRLRE domain-containing protein [Bacteroidota bacterium]